MDKIIEGKLAVNGISAFDFNFLNEDTTHQTDQKIDNKSWAVADVRDLYDDGSNALQDYEKMIDKAYALMQQHDRVVICCVDGMSRSNAIALGVLVKYFKMDFDGAWDLIRRKVPDSDIKPGHILQLKKLFNITLD
jgi:protein-tyrosine phosphatase